jgi:hypothetical protein
MYKAVFSRPGREGLESKEGNAMENGLLLFGYTK